MKRSEVSALVRELVEDFRKEWGKDAKTPEAINGGLCQAFSETLCERLRARGEFRALTCDSQDLARLKPAKTKGIIYQHSWTFFQGRHYDSEAPEGVEDWRDLPFFGRLRAYGIRVRRADTAPVERKRLAASLKFVEACWRAMAAEESKASQEGQA